MKIEFSDWLQIQETLARYNRHRYADEIVRDGDRWRIRQRTYSPVFTSHGPHAAPPVPE
jgi:hypothetical protein